MENRCFAVYPVPDFHKRVQEIFANTKYIYIYIYIYIIIIIIIIKRYS